METRAGEAIVLSRRRPTDKVDTFGQPMVFYPSRPCTIAECLNLETGCSVQVAGTIVDGVFIEDTDLFSLGQLYNAALAHMENQEHDRDPKPDPGE